MDRAVRTLSRKVCLLGDYAVGKTSLVRRFVYDQFDGLYRDVVGVKVSHKAVAVPSSVAAIELTIMLWDLADRSDFDSSRVSFLRGAVGAVVVCDVTRPSTIDSLYKYYRDVRASNPDVHLILAANKSDLADPRDMMDAQLEAVALAFKAPFYRTSARTGANVGDLFRHLAQMLASNAGLEPMGQINHTAPRWAADVVSVSR